jgi:TolA-binding protein
MENVNKENKIPIKTPKENIRPIYLTKRILSQKDCADYCNGKVEWGSFLDVDNLQRQIDELNSEIEEMKNAGKKLGQLNDTIINKVLKNEV